MQPYVIILPISKQELRYCLSLVAILILALLRYLDLIGGYLGAAGLFLGMAALLFVAGRYWRRREARL